MPDNLTVKDVERIWRTVKEQVDDIVWDMVTRLCIAYAEEREQFYRRKFNNSEGDDAIAFQEGGPWQSLLNRMKEHP